ncbi:MAG: hypothetical protein WCB36_02890, partial [Burkholderiales bacterium]
MTIQIEMFRVNAFFASSCFGACHAVRQRLAKAFQISAITLFLIFSLPNSTWAVPSVSTISSPTVNEGGVAEFVVTLSEITIQPATFRLTLGGGTATGGTDYSLTMTYSSDGGVTFKSLLSGGNAVIPAGVRALQLRVVTLGDNLSELTESFQLTVAPLTGATGNPQVGIGNIANVVPPPTPITTRYLAQNAVRTGNVIMSTGVLNYIGSGFAANFWYFGDSVTFNVSVPAAGVYTSALRYMQASG